MSTTEETPPESTSFPRNLRIDSGGDEFAVSNPAPRLSWRPTRSANVWEIEATVDGVSQPLASTSEHLFVDWPWVPLRSRQVVRWRVRAVGGGWSASHTFEAGLFAEDWAAQWVSPIESESSSSGKRGAHIISASFAVASDIARGRMYATALGVYEAAVNGCRVGTAELAPGSTSYDATLYAQAFDVTESLRTGANTVEFLLADGWYRGQVGAHRKPVDWGTRLGLRVEIHLDLADGSHQIVPSDATWMSSSSQVVRADLMDGQTTDFTVERSTAAPVLVDAVAGPAVSWSPAPPVRVIESREPLSVTAVSEGVWLADFGQNASGWVELTDLGPHGTRTVIDFGEFVGANGDLSTSHLNSVRPGEPEMVFVQRDEVISDGQGNTFEPRLTVHGFRYARITRAGAPLDPTSITMRIVHTDLRRTGTFSSSSDELNRLYEISEWSFRGNAVDVPTDCPTRERLAWSGDYQVFIPTATRMFDVLGFSRKWLQSARDDQLDDGRITNFSPDGRRIKHHLDDQFAMMTGSAGWGDAIVSVPWELYVSYGDRGVLSENWEAMTRWVDWASNVARTARHPSRVQRSPEELEHEQYLWDGSFHWGEWIEPKEKDAEGNPIDPVQSNPVAWFTADKGEVGTAFLYRSTDTVARIAGILGHRDDARRYGDLAAKVADAWRAEFLDERGHTVADTQASYVRALSFGLVPDELRSAAADRLVELIHSADMHLATGFLSTGDLLPVLVDTGHADVAYALLLQRTAPSWLYMVDHGATTIWEEWEGIDEHGVAHASLNHYSKGAVARFLHTHVLGLSQAPGSVAWESFIVAPVPGPGVTSCTGSHDSPRGEIAVSWNIEHEEMLLAVIVPPATTARLVFPDGSHEIVGEGSHERVVTLLTSNGRHA